MAHQSIKILVSESDGFSAEAAAQLRGAGELVLADLERKDLLEAVRDVDVLWVRLRHQIDSEIFQHAAKLKILVTPTTGLNHIDLLKSKQRSVKVLSLRGETEFLQDVRATAEHTMGLIFSLLRHVPRSAAHVRSGGWNRDLFRGWELHRKTVGVVGYGRLGKIVTRYLRGFETRILVTDPLAKVLERGVVQVPLRRLLMDSDIITLHVDLHVGTRGMFGPDAFALMKTGAWLINTSRGEVVDEEALLGSLRSSKLAGAALDVLSNERSGGMGNHPLVAYAREHDNLLITPHLGGCTKESMEKTELFLADRLLNAIAANKIVFEPQHALPAPLLYS
jgi:D-3-phosphoglycerate dehydrogenase